MKKVVGKLVGAVSFIWDSILIIVVIALLLLRFAPIPFGYTPVVCMSNSMAPTFHEGALCFIDRSYDVGSITKGDIIAFELSNGQQVTHRVYDITGDGIVTKGDANESVDISAINESQIIGENVMQLEYIGNVYKKFPENKLVILVGLFAVSVSLLLNLTCKSLLKEKEENEENDKGDDTVVSNDECK